MQILRATPASSSVSSLNALPLQAHADSANLTATQSWSVLYRTTSACTSSGVVPYQNLPFFFKVIDQPLLLRSQAPWSADNSTFDMGIAASMTSVNAV